MSQFFKTFIIPALSQLRSVRLFFSTDVMLLAVSAQFISFKDSIMSQFYVQFKWFFNHKITFYISAIIILTKNDIKCLLQTYVMNQKSAGLRAFSLTTKTCTFLYQNVYPESGKPHTGIFYLNECVIF